MTNHIHQPNCLFCKFVTGEATTPGIFWEDAEYMAFLSIAPNTMGFSVVIPKNHLGSDLLALPDDQLQGLVLAAKKVSQVLLKHFEDVGRVGLIMEGMGVNHAHIKLFPMHGTQYLKTGEWKQGQSETSKFFEKYEGFIQSNSGPRMDDTELAKLATELKKLS